MKREELSRTKVRILCQGSDCFNNEMELTINLYRFDAYTEARIITSFWCHECQRAFSTSQKYSDFEAL